MSLPPASESFLQHLQSADRLARAASLWLRREYVPGTVPPRPGPAHRDLLAGVVAGLGAWLDVDDSVLLVGAYSLGLLEQERAHAVDIPARLARTASPSAHYRQGLRIARRLIGALRDSSVVSLV
jgi:hypothetical protein